MAMWNGMGGELQRLERLILSVRAKFSSKSADPFQHLGFLTPVDESGRCVPPLSAEPTLQERLEAFDHKFLALTLLMKLRPPGPVPNFPTPGCEGRDWYRGLAKHYRLLRTQFAHLKQEVLLHHWTLFVAVFADICDHAIAAKYGPLLALAADRVRNALPDQDPVRLEAFEEKRVAAYKKIHHMRRVVPDANSLSVSHLRRRLARLFEVTLQRWDRGHGLEVPQVRDCLAALAYKEEGLFLEVELPS
jgi:hypothetical protein